MGSTAGAGPIGGDIGREDSERTSTTDGPSMWAGSSA